MELKRTGFYFKSYAIFHAKNTTVKWKGRNLFSYSVSVMLQIVSTKNVLALVCVKLWPPVFQQKSIATEIILTAKKVYLKPTLQCTYVNTAKEQHLYSCFHKK